MTLLVPYQIAGFLVDCFACFETGLRGCCTGCVLLLVYYFACIFETVILNFALCFAGYVCFCWTLCLCFGFGWFVNLGFACLF